MSVGVRLVLTVLDKSRHFCSRNFSASLVYDLYYSLGLPALPLLLSFPRCVSTSACTRRTRCGQKYQRNLSGGGARYSNTSVGRRSRTSLCLNKACCGLLLYQSCGGLLLYRSTRQPRDDASLHPKQTTRTRLDTMYKKSTD